MKAPASHLHPTDLIATRHLVIDAVAGITRLVESMHHTIVQVPAPLGPGLAGQPGGITGFVYRCIHGTTRLVGGGLDLLLAGLLPLLSAKSSAAASPQREAVLAALNGVLGDYLARSGNPLATTMTLRHAGRPLELTEASLAAAIPQPRPRILLLVHGLCMNDEQWQRRSPRETEAGNTGAAVARKHDPWPALARRLGCTLIHLRYNSGLNISTNGRAFAAQLEALVANWPVPVESLSIVGHSMGGLVARSACHYAALEHQAWLKRLRHLVFLGSPHHGAPLERGGHGIDRMLASSPYTAPFARLGQVRSAGITDLRHGNLLDDDWQGHDRFAAGPDRRQPIPLPAGVGCYAIAASTGAAAGTLADRLLGDGLVTVDSALGWHDEQVRRLPLAQGRHLDRLRPRSPRPADRSGRARQGGFLAGEVKRDARTPTSVGRARCRCARTAAPDRSPRRPPAVTPRHRAGRPAPRPAAAHRRRAPARAGCSAPRRRRACAADARWSPAPGNLR
jgi:hypothetical protein